MFLRVDVDGIKQALKDKVYPVIPLHIGVDVESKEGVVFMKLANKADAKAAFIALHGDWYSGRLVSVKYVRDRRYAERYPETAHL